MATASAAAPVRQAQLRENIRSTDVESLMITAVISQEEDETTTPPLKQTTRNVDSQQSQPQGHASISSSSSSSSNQSTDVSSPSSPVLLKEGDPVVPVYPAAATFTPRRSPRKRAALSHSAITTTSTFTSTYSAPTATPSTPKSTRRSPRRQAVAAAAAATATATATATSSLGVISTPTLRRSPRKRKATPHPSHQSPKQVKLQSATYETSPTTSSPPTAVVNTSLDTSGSFSEFEEQGVSSIRLFPSASSSPEMPPYQTLIATVREQVVASIPLTAKPAPGKSILRRTNFPSPVLSESSSTSPFPEGSQKPAATTLEQVHLRLQEIFPDKQVTNMVRFIYFL